MNQPRPTCFISYSHSDRAHAERLTSALQQRGLDVWIDALQILPGDSLVEKIFEEGLKNCSLFLVLLSPRSVQSAWVRHELDVAVINRLKRVTRVIPLVVEKCEIPVTLRALRWLDMSDGVARAADLIAAAAFQKKPESGTVGDPPKFVKHAIQPRAGLSQEAATVGGFLAKNISTKEFPSEFFDGEKIQEGTGLPPEMINDAVDELSANGLVRLHHHLGTVPYEFGWAEPTYALAYTFPDLIDGHIDPTNDVRQVAATVASLKEADGDALAEALNFEPNRINFAIEYLRDYGLIETQNFIGTAPYSFGHAMATRATRQYVHE